MNGVSVSSTNGKSIIQFDDMELEIHKGKVSINGQKVKYEDGSAYVSKKKSSPMFYIFLGVFIGMFISASLGVSINW
jgi:hypothetical protein